MSTPFSYAPLQVPDDWTPEQALGVYEYLTQMAEAVWERYQIDLLPLVRPDPSAQDSAQPDLFDPDDELPFQRQCGGNPPAAVPPSFPSDKASSLLRTPIPAFPDCTVFQLYSTGAINVGMRPDSAPNQFGKLAVE